VIVQTAPEGEPHFVITQVDHARMSGQFAAAWGNETFAEIIPREPMEFMVAHHDEGWAKLDDACLLDENTHLPYHLTQTPLTELIKTGAGSPDFNQAHHPYSGILSSMHTWGLYRGRYGLSDKIFINSISAEHRPQVDTLLEGEITRQDHLKRQLEITNAEMVAWSKPTQLFHNYKLLQFFDTLALYFHTTHEASRGEATFINVPTSVGKDETITVKRQSDGSYSLTPYPFAKNPLEVTVEGRYLSPLKAGVKLADVMWATPKTTQTYKLVAG
jgi:hypothetical protein